MFTRRVIGGGQPWSVGQARVDSVGVILGLTRHTTGLCVMTLALFLNIAFMITACVLLVASAWLALRITRPGNDAQGEENVRLGPSRWPPTRPSGSPPSPRRRAELPVEIDRGADEREVRERLREVA
jgi:hypothetical protein